MGIEDLLSALREETVTGLTAAIEIYREAMADGCEDDIRDALQYIRDEVLKDRSAVSLVILREIVRAERRLSS